MHKAYVALGSNLGDSRALITRAIEAMNLWPDVRVQKISSLYLTEPIDIQGPDFLNAVAYIHAEIDAFTLLSRLLTLESLLGRSEKVREGSRLMDLDLLLFDEMVIKSHLLVLPHPRLHERAFVLEPLLELDASITIPQTGRAETLIEHTRHQRVERLLDPIELMQV